MIGAILAILSELERIGELPDAPWFAVDEVGDRDELLGVGVGQPVDHPSAGRFAAAR